MKYSVVIPVFLNNPSHAPVVQATIKSVKASSDDYELIIVDDGSTLLTGFLRSEADTYIRHNPTNRGIAPSWNDGKNIARGEFVAIINDDIVVPDGWLDALALAFEKDDCGVAGVYQAGPTVVPALGGNCVKDYKWFSGYCFMLKKDRFFENFDEQFVPAQFEDTDYWVRMIKNDFFLYKSPLSIYHAEGDVLHKMDYKGITSKNKKRFIEKHGFDPIPGFYGNEDLYNILNKTRG